MTATPFVVGQWVRGERFYGRAQLIEEILHGQRNWLWLLGTRSYTPVGASSDEDIAAERAQHRKDTARLAAAIAA